MKRRIIVIDQAACNGCGLCVNACQEGALKLVNGKAQLVSESYCDGLGACLPQCLVNAIRIVEREAAPFDEIAVQAAMQKQPAAASPKPQATQPFSSGGCPGMQARRLHPSSSPVSGGASDFHLSQKVEVTRGSQKPLPDMPSALRQWPCQIKLAPVGAPWFDGADLLLAADCTAFACASLHRDFMPGKITLIGCPKMDAVDHAEKLGAILAAHEIRSLTVLRMEVPCCGGLAAAAQRAVVASGRTVPLRIVTLGIDGQIVEDVNTNPTGTTP